MNHPKLDIEHWCRLFPLSNYEKHEGPRHYSSIKPGDPLDLWKAGGRIISSPEDLAVVEQVRRRAAKEKELGRKVPVDIFLWSQGSADKPYLTKTGGVPHRETGKKWPTAENGNPMTFVAQICFLDSKDIVPKNLSGDVMLIFFASADGHYYDANEISVEWSSIELKQPMTKAHCPKPSFGVPELSGVIYRTCEYPDSWDAFESLGHAGHYLFMTTQSTKIGTETWIIQNDPRKEEESLLCTLNSLQPRKRWPFTNLESLTDNDRDKYTIMFADVGCIYFLIDKNGNVRWVWDCY